MWKLAIMIAKTANLILEDAGAPSISISLKITTLLAQL